MHIGSDWITVGASAIGAIAIVVGGVSGYVGRRRNQGAQARKVSAWVPGGESIIPAGFDLGHPWGTSPIQRVAFTLLVRNDSDEPIADVAVAVENGEGHEVIGAQHWSLIPPGGEIKNAISIADSGIARGLQLRARFTDAHGRRWQRRGSSLLRLRR